MSAKQLQMRLVKMKDRISKRRAELADLSTQQKELATQLAVAKSMEKAKGTKTTKGKSRTGKTAKSMKSRTSKSRR